MLQISESSAQFSDQDIAQIHLHLKMKPYGGCFLIDHPEFGINMSMGTFFFCSTYSIQDELCYEFEKVKSDY